MSLSSLICSFPFIFPRPWRVTSVSEAIIVMNSFSLDCFTDFLHSVDERGILPISGDLFACARRWCRVPNVSTLQSSLAQLPDGAFLPLYFAAQNAAILIEIESNDALISAWEVLLPVEIVLAATEPHLSSFPPTNHRLSPRSQLNSSVHCQLLLDFFTEPVEPSQSHYVCRWWIEHFAGIRRESPSNTFLSFKKKHRDQVRWNSGPVPFRRSGLWTTVKVVFHTILSKRLVTRGTGVYKLLITHFLTAILHSRHAANSPALSLDLLVHCIRKIVRRLSKVEVLLPLGGLEEWVQWTMKDIREKIETIFPKTNFPRAILSDLELDDRELYRHRCDALRTYLNTQSSTNSQKLAFDAPECLEQEEGILPSFKVLTTQWHSSVGVALTQMELWALDWTDQWLARPSSAQRETEHFQILARFFADYHAQALAHYRPRDAPADPLGYTRFFVTSLTLIFAMHRKLSLDPRFQRLSDHRLDLVDLFDSFLLLTLDELTRVRSLFAYFSRFTLVPHPALLSDIAGENSFAVHFAERSTKLLNSLRKIQGELEEDKAAKRKEVQQAKDKYHRLLTSISGCPCTCSAEQLCRRCRLQQQANDIEVNLYECPMPSERASALSVIFELRMPVEVRCYRDVLWLFANRSSPPSETRHYEWLRVLPHAAKLEPYFTGPRDLKVKLVSSTPPIKHTQRPATAPLEQFFAENTLQVQLSPFHTPSLHAERQLFTPQLRHPDFVELQFALESTQCVQNRVIAQLTDSKTSLKAKEWIDFGSLRSGHRLQWWNVLSLLEMDSLSLNEESVAVLLHHTILQNGPMTKDSPWCPESHQPLLDDRFVDQLLATLNRHLDECHNNWHNALALLVITLITLRIFTLCNASRIDEVSTLLLKCRRTGEKWSDLLSPSGFEKEANLRLQMLTISAACLLTFSTDAGRISCVLSSQQHVISLLRAATNLHDNTVPNKKATPMSPFLRDILRMTERNLMQIQPTLAELLRKSAYRSLNEFSSIYWAVLRNDEDVEARWKKRRRNIYDGWYDGHLRSTSLSIDCVQGQFCVNGISVGYLPEKIISHHLYQRVFGEYIFPVQVTDSPKTFITKHSYHGEEQVQYEFEFNEELNRLIVRERHLKTNAVFELLPPKCFESDLPVVFVAEFSHWKAMSSPLIDFRPLRFTDPHFLTNTPFVLNTDTGHLTSTDPVKSQTLINRSSPLFLNLFTRYFSRLDDSPYVVMLSDDTSPTSVVHIHLSRLPIAFQYQTKNDVLLSREYPEMCVDREQCLGTLTGMRFGLVLSPMTSPGERQGSLTSRRLLVPFGHLHASRRSPVEHQLVTLERKSKMDFAQHYFVFVVNDRLRVIQSTDSPTGWLYLALLHAMTSHPLPDHFTGITGMERAFQLLNSPGCWTDQPFEPLARSILQQIAAISPKVSVYRPLVNGAPKIDWNPPGLPHSLQHVGYYLLVNRLIRASEQLSFMHSEVSAPLSDAEEHDERLLIKLYWDYRRWHNPLARLSPEIEAELFKTSEETPYQPTVECPSSSTVNHESARRVNVMYQSGDLRLRTVSELCSFPLSKWLTDEYSPKAIWIGLLQLAHSLRTASPDDLERYELLLDFLRYTSSRTGMRPFYLQILNTVLHQSTASLIFPPLTQYRNVQQVSVTPSAIDFHSRHSASERRVIGEEIKDCLEKGHFYKDQCRLATSEEKHQIKLLLSSWQLNRRLQAFLSSVQQLTDEWNLRPFLPRVSVDSQQFTQKSDEDRSPLSEKAVDPQLLRTAERKYRHPNPDAWMKTTRSVDNARRERDFPEEIFSAIDDEKTQLAEIGRSFKNHLAASWSELHSSPSYQKEYPSEEEICQQLDSLRGESSELWEELHSSITSVNVQFFQSGLALRVIPSVLLSLFQQIWLDERTLLAGEPALTRDQCTLLGGMTVNWVVEQHLERALHFSRHGQREEFERELSNRPHVNWTPSEHLPWLIFELEMNFTIREIQVEVARHMSEPPVSKENLVMQMNMGEGKTSVIIPMLALSLASPGCTLLRVVVLKSLFPSNSQLLRYKLGALLNRRVFPFACRREMNFTPLQVQQIVTRLQQALRRGDVVLVTPEDLLSFDLLTLEKCRRQDFDAGRSMLNTQRWLTTVARDILDESDEVLHCKYQLIYTVGRQQPMEGGIERWKLIQWVLHSVKRWAEDIARDDENEVFYRAAERQSAFPHFRLLSHRPFSSLCSKIATDWLNRKSYRKSDQQCLFSFILDTESSLDVLLDRFSPAEIQSLLIIRGLLCGEVLFVGLRKRYRVNYGINRKSKFNRLMAVPFRAKDVPAERTEFGHPDIALLLTQLSYYYGGLSASQVLQCLDRLREEERDPEAIYAEWIDQEEESNLSHGLKQWKGVNLKDDERETRHLCRILRCNFLVVDYFLNHFVFPREGKQFPHRLVSSAWDLSAPTRTKMITGFSGTNDTQLLLPTHISQCDLPQLQKTDALVLDHLLQTENEQYRCLSMKTSSETILREMVNDHPTINVILDVGALLIDGTNREIALQWLQLTNKSHIDYAIYFEFDCLLVCDRQGHHHSFLSSPASERLDRCVVYLDEAHTRGTDFKFPHGFRAAVTLGNGLTKDRFVQACMRMRKLGAGHSLTFWSSDEVHRQIASLKARSQSSHAEAEIYKQEDILRWVYNNTQQATWDGLHHWAIQSLSYQRKLSAFQNMQRITYQPGPTDQMMTELADQCLEPEIVELKGMYGISKALHTLPEIYLSRHQHSTVLASEELHNAVLQRLCAYGGSKQRLSQFLDDEQQRELEQEVEQEQEREKEEDQRRAPPVRPCQPILHEEIKRLCHSEDSPLKLEAFPSVFRPLAAAFADSPFSELCQFDRWRGNFWISSEFQRVIEMSGEASNLFLRPPRWMIVYRNEHVIFVSAFEANWLLGQLHSRSQQEEFPEPPLTTLRLFLPRVKPNQSIMINTPLHGPLAFLLPVEWLAELFVFNGTLYFESEEEQSAYCQCLALCPKPWTTQEEDAFENGWIAVDGFVQEPEHRSLLQIHGGRFQSDPLTFVKQLLEHRNNAFTSVTSHVGSIILDARKVFLK